MLSNTKRCEAEIVYEILSASRHEIKKTTLMHKQNYPIINSYDI